MDFPRGWEIARSVIPSKHDPRCSYAQTNGGMLCDCHVLYQHWEYLRDYYPKRKPKLPRLWVYTFKPRFVSRVRDGRKLRTMRPKRKDGRRPISGDRISLRYWKGKPYWSAQVPLFDSTIKAVSTVVIEQLFYPLVEGRRLKASEANEFAHYDGFEDYADMQAWFAHEHGDRVELDMIEWLPAGE